MPGNVVNQNEFHGGRLGLLRDTLHRGSLAGVAQTLRIYRRHDESDKEAANGIYRATVLRWASELYYGISPWLHGIHVAMLS